MQYQLCNIKDLPVGLQGVYSLVNASTDRLYVGSTVCIRSRVKDHIDKLNRRVHSNHKLQKAWNIYGQSAFYLNIVETVNGTRNEVFDAEQIYIDAIGTEHLYNINPKAYCPPGGKSLKGIKKTPQAVANSKAGLALSLARRKQEAIERGDPDSWLSKEAREKMGASNRGKKKPPEWGENIRRNKLGKKRKPFSEEHKRKLAAANRNLKGQKRSGQALENIRAAARDPSRRAKIRKARADRIIPQSQIDKYKATVANRSPERRAEIKAIFSKAQKDAHARRQQCLTA